MSCVFPAPPQKRYMKPNMELPKKTLMHLFKREHGKEASNWEECYAWCKVKSSEVGWSSVRATNTRVIFEYNEGLAQK